MENFIAIWNQIMCVAVFAAIITSCILLFTLFVPENSFAKQVHAFVQKNILVLGFLTALAALVSSLTYSNIIGFPPCLLCWYSRIFFYPQLFLFGMAFWKKDFKIIDYALVLTAIGTLISLYHVISENIGYSVLPCEASGPSCLIKYVYEYGFITIPVMGLVGFGSLLLMLIVAKKAAK
jgi:disulfide bond formation protein DsbB